MNAAFSMLFRSYPSVNPAHEKCTIWQAACATSATPGIFNSVVVGRDQHYVDGGIGSNNPMKLVLSEAQEPFPGRQVASIVSVGAGHPKTISLTPTSMLETLKQMAADSEATHDEMEQLFSRYPDLYFRFNVEQGTQTPNLDPAHVEAHTNAYLSLAKTKICVKRAAAVTVSGDGLVDIEDLSMNAYPLSYQTRTHFSHRFSIW